VCAPPDVARISNDIRPRSEQYGQSRNRIALEHVQAPARPDMSAFEAAGGAGTRRAGRVVPAESVYVATMNAGPQGRMCAVPCRVTEDLQVTHMMSYTGAAGEITSLAAFGVTQVLQEPALVIAFDIPSQTCESVDYKETQELHDVNTFLIDCLPVARITAESIPSPNDPPDVVAFVDGRGLEIEATHFLLPESELDKSKSIISRWMMFDRLRKSILDHESPQDLSHHRAMNVMVWFGGMAEDREQHLPPKRNVDIASAIAALKRVTPPPPVIEMIDNPDVVRWSDDQSVGFSWGPLPLGYTSPFFEQMQFELGLGYDVMIKRSDLRAELRRLVIAHDTNDSDILLIAVNAPIRSGLEFPSSSLLAQMLFEDDEPLDGWQPLRIQRIALHDQGNNRVRWLLGTPPWD